ncbi:MAG: tetraacyldisaccharide 4'-kinase [bacterium]
MNPILNCYFDIIYGKKRGIIPFFVKIFLFIISRFYSFFLETRKIFYFKGILETKRLPVPVISVGNITLGGTGKTPFIIWLAGFLKKEGYKTGILTRGYGRKNKHLTVVLSADNEITDYNTAGDEPLLIKNHVDKEIPVVIGPDRAKTGLLLYEKFRPEVVLLDDGFQHISIKRDLNIVLIDALNPFGNFKVFPAGILREKTANLKRADIFLITKTDLISKAEKDKIAGFLEIIGPGTVIIESIFRPGKFINLKTKEEYAVEYVSQKRCAAFSGIGNPDSFLKTLAKYSILPIDYVSYPDHYPFQGKDINAILEKNKNSDYLLTTEKDAIRLGNLDDKDWGNKILALCVKLEITAGGEILRERIIKILK